jgi:hypothetical protein
MEKLIDILEQHGYLVFKNETEFFISKNGNTTSWSLDVIKLRLTEMKYNELSAILKHFFEFRYN